MDKWRDRKFRLLLYPDDPTHAQCMELLKTGGYKFAAILHDEDTWVDGDEDLGKHEIGSKKKAHWHVVLKFPQAKWSTAIEKELGIKGNYIRKCNSFDDSLLYLVHEGCQDKHQYEFEKVFGPLAPALGKLLIDDDEGMRVLEIVRMIDDSPAVVGYRELLVKACNNGLYGEFRRLGSGIKWLIDEHNEQLGFEQYSNGKKPTAGVWADAIDQSRFEGFVCGHQAGINERHNGVKR